ncbi:MAG: glycosyltransferase family 4 protein [Saprospiraceae bacterium]|nr:glycosyltransferase family 4 protein [Saprospiraceae bacterium]
MRILQLCKKFPYPLKDGESIAVTHLSKALHQMGCELMLLSMNTNKHHFDTKQLPLDYNYFKQIHSVDVNISLNNWDAFVNLIKGTSYHVTRFISDEFNQKLIELLKDNVFDVIQLETLYLAPYIPTIQKYTNAIIALRAHNIEHEIWERIIDHHPNNLRRWYLKHLTKQLKKYELDQFEKYDLLIAFTDRDLGKFRKLGYHNGAITSPIGIELNQYKASVSPPKPLSVTFIGALDWMPNSEALNWFLHKVWNRLRMLHSEFELHVAGRNCPENLKNLRLPGVIMHGEVENSNSFISQHPVMVVPLLSGSGMRVKILEGMALGKLIITTSLGLEGIPAIHKEHIMIADTPEEFITSFEYIYSHPEEMIQMGHRAVQFVSERYDTYKIAAGLLHKYQSLIDTGYK